MTGGDHRGVEQFDRGAALWDMQKTFDLVSVENEQKHYNKICSSKVFNSLYDDLLHTLYVPTIDHIFSALTVPGAKP